jgi:ferredoxin-fold anticodon binding domain-containing protein
MSLRRHLNAEGVAHAHADSKTHARHVRQRKARSGVEWIPEPVEDSGASVFRLKGDGLGLGMGRYFIGHGSEEKNVGGKDFESHCNGANWARRWNFADMTRAGKKSRVKRQREAPACQEIVVNVSPAQMIFLNSELERWERAGIPAAERREMVVEMVDEMRKAVVAEFKAATGWDVVASYAHFDSNKVHVGVVASRVGPDNNLLGNKSLGTLGPWSVGQNRLAKLGLVDAGDTRLKENLDRFKSRYGAERQPLDIRLHDVLDQVFAGQVEKLKAGERYAQAQEEYKVWKLRNRREAFTRSAGSARVAWQTLRLVTPLLPPQIQTALALAHTAMRAFEIVGAALDSLNPPQPSGQQTSRKELEKIL